MTTGHRTESLSSFDRAGVAIVAVLGGGCGFFLDVATDPAGMAILVPAAMVGASPEELLETASRTFAISFYAGSLCGLALYAWDGLANVLIRALRECFR
jgi:hypothetical protein